MYIFDEYRRFKTVFKNVNEFIYKNRIQHIIDYYNKNIKSNLSNKLVNYDYYHEFEMNVIDILKDKTTDPYIPPFRLLTYNAIHENSFGIHRYGWKYVISNFLNQSYSVSDPFYFENPDFEWTSYAYNYGLDDYESVMKHYLGNIQYKHKMVLSPMKFMIFDEWLEKKYVWSSVIRKPEYKYPFISFIHDPPLYDVEDDIYRQFEKQNTKTILEKNEDFLEEKDNLRILITLSDYHEKYISKNVQLSENTVVKSLYHPLELSNTKYMFNLQKFIENDKKSLFMVGWWLRKYDVFLKLSCAKTIIMKNNEGKHVKNHLTKQIKQMKDYEEMKIPINYNTDLIEEINQINELNDSNEINESNYVNEDDEFEYLVHLLNTKYNTKIYDFLEDKDYDQLFYNNIFFLDIYNCIANNIILECIMNNTPILVCYNKSVIEYLGKDYPFYFTNYEDAEKKSRDLELIINTHFYLKHMDKTRFTYEYFNHSLRNIIMENI
jgi:hypothetical protein